MNTEGLDLATFINSACCNNRDDMFGNGNGLGWLLILLLFGARGFGGFGGWGFGNGVGAGAVINDNAITGQIEAAINKASAAKLSDDLILQAINGNADAINQIACSLNSDFESVRCALSNIDRVLCQLSGDMKMSTEQIINALQKGNCDIEKALFNCCCEMKTMMTTQNYENRIANMQQTETLMAALNNGFRGMEDRLNAQTTIMNQQFYDIKTREDAREIQGLRDQVQDLKNERAIQNQTNISNAQFSELYQRIPERPVPAYFSSPYGNNWGWGWNGCYNPCNPCNCCKNQSTGSGTPAQ